MTRRRLGAVALVLVSIASCKRDASDPAIAAAIGDARRIAAGDLDGDGRDEIVTVDSKRLRVIDRSGRERARRPVSGGIQVLLVADIDGDARAEILAGWGESRDHRGAAARITMVRLEGDALVEELVAEPETSRADVVEILPMSGGRLFVAYFESKYMVRLATARRDDSGWSLSTIETIRMATSFALGDVDGDGELDLVVGRVYGDHQDAEGDAFVRRPDGARVPIPVTGGVRTLAVTDLGDGRLEVLAGDGWNKDYGRRARARLTRARWTNGSFRSELVEDSSGEYTLWQILPIDLDGDGSREIITRGSARVRVLSSDGDRWTAKTVASGCRDATTADLDRRPPIELLVLCEGGARIIRQ